MPWWLSSLQPWGRHLQPLSNGGSKDTKMEDDPKAGDDATKEIQDNPNDVMETAGDPVKKDKQPYD